MKVNRKILWWSMVALSFASTGCELLKKSSSSSPNSNTATTTPTESPSVGAAPTPVQTPVSTERMWYIGGYDASGTTYNTVFNSNGGAWSTGTFPSSCASATASVFNSQLFHIGGLCLSGDHNYSSSDGVNYADISSLGGTLQRSAVAIFKNKIWLAGGFLGGSITNMVLNTTDGITFIAAVGLPQPRMAGALAVLGNKMYFIGGQDAAFNPTKTVWSTTDGMSWNPEMNLPDVRAAMGVTVMNNKIWAVAGGGQNFNPQSQVWYTNDGVSWLSLGNTLPSPRSNGSLVAYKNKLWYVGGYNGGGRSEVFSSPDGVTWTAEQPLPIGLYNGALVVF